MSDSLRESKWRYAQRLRARYRTLRTRYPLLARTIGPLARVGVESYARWELPRSVGVAETGLAAFEGVWPNEGLKEVRARWHRYRLCLDLSDYFQRLAWVLRRWPDVPTQMVLWQALRKGDTLIDGGANIGAMSLLGAWRVGPRGLVHAFEPGPRALERLRWHVEINRLRHVTVHPVGLSDRSDTLALLSPRDGNLGASTFSPLPDRFREAGAESTVARTVRFDDVQAEVRGQLVIKLDIEGFEMRALRGMSAALNQHRPLIITEVNAEMLHQAGASRDEMAIFLTDLGYSPHAYSTRWPRKLRLWRVDPGDLPVDVVWIRPESAAAARLQRFIV